MGRLWSLIDTECVQWHMHGYATRHETHFPRCGSRDPGTAPRGRIGDRSHNSPHGTSEVVHAEVQEAGPEVGHQGQAEALGRTERNRRLSGHRSELTDAGNLGR